MVLGIIGGVLAILLALLFIAGGVFFSQAFPALMESNMDYEMDSDYNYSFDNDDFEGLDLVGYIYGGLGIVVLIGGVLGLVGGLLVNKNNVLAGVLMLIGGVMIIYLVLLFILLLLGGIFALVKDNSVTNNPELRADFE